MKKSAVILALALGVSAWTIAAQDQGGPPPPGELPPLPERGPQDRPGMGVPPGTGGPGLRGERRGPGGPGMGRQGRDQRGPQGGFGMDGQRRPNLPIVATLDFNGDGIIDSREIAMASESLKRLDKNGDGKLTPDEYLPPRPPGQRGQGGPGMWGQGNSGGPGGPGMGGAGGLGGRGGPGDARPGWSRWPGRTRHAWFRRLRRSGLSCSSWRSTPSRPTTRR